MKLLGKNKTESYFNIIKILKLIQLDYLTWSGVLSLSRRGTRYLTSAPQQQQKGGKQKRWNRKQGCYDVPHATKSMAQLKTTGAQPLRCSSLTVGGGGGGRGGGQDGFCVCAKMHKTGVSPPYTPHCSRCMLYETLSWEIFSATYRTIFSSSQDACRCIRISCGCLRSVGSCLTWTLI